MNLLERLFGKGKAKKNEADQTGSNLKSEDIIQLKLARADAAMESGDFAQAAECYQEILKNTSNETAQYNLASLYAQGKGVEQDFMKAAFWFHKSELAGDEQAGKLCLKCAMDFIHQNFEAKSPELLYVDMASFIHYVYTEATDINLETCRKLYAIAGNHFKKQEYEAAAKLFRAAAEFGSDGYSQNYLGVLYNAGAGVEKNDLASLYWFDKAVDNGAADVAQTDRDGILNAYRNNLEPGDFYNAIMRLSKWCCSGSEGVAKDVAKALYWRRIAVIFGRGENGGQL